MKKLKSYYINTQKQKLQNRNNKCSIIIFPITIASLLSLLLLLLLTSSFTTQSGLPLLPFLPSSFSAASRFIEPKLRPLPISSLPPPPRFAYLISGSSGDGAMLKRTLLALYHPWNRYIVHLDLECGPEERSDLARFVSTHPVFVNVGNVRVISKANLVTYRGPTMVANTLHAAALLLKEAGDWDWFVNLSASDYPLVTQDGENFVFLL